MPICRIVSWKWYDSSVTRIRVGAEEELDVLHAGDEAVESLLFVTEQRVSRDDDLPLGVPDAAADQAGVGIFRRDTAVEEGRIAHGAEGRMSCNSGFCRFWASY